MKVLLYEPDKRTGEAISYALHREGYDVNWIKDFLNAKSKILDERFDASLIEIDDCEDKGLQLIESWITRTPGLLCVAIYRDQDTETGFQACRLGSQEIYEIEYGSLHVLDRILKRYRVLGHRPQKYHHKSDVHNKAVRDLTSLVNHNKPVLISGESGTGKSFIAEHIHCNKTNRNFDFEVISCADLAVEHGMELLLGVTRGFRKAVTNQRKGILAKANERGLLFLKDIVLMPGDIQDVLASVLERGEFRSVGSDVRIEFTAQLIASCNNVSDINPDKFNRRLYDILIHNLIKIPSLRECPADIVPIAQQMIEDYCIMKGIENIPTIDSSAILKITTHNWPGNYRELKNCIENAVTCCTNALIKAEDLNIPPQADAECIPKDRRGRLIFYLTKYSGKKIDVMKALGITAPTLDKWLKDEGIDYKLFKNKKRKGRASKQNRKL